MRCVTLSCLAAIAICLTANAAADDLASAEQLVAQLDRVRQPARSYLADVTVSEFRSGRRERDATFRIYCRKVSNGFDVLALCLTPLRDSGKLFLASSDKLWFYDPRSARPVPIAPNQARTHELLFDALGDSLASQYSARVEGEELTADLARRQLKRLVLALIPNKTKGAPASLRYWLEPESNRPTKSEIIAPSGRSIRTLYYSDFRKALGEERPMRWVMVNPAENTLVELRLSNMAYSDAPAAMFDPNQLASTSALLKQQVDVDGPVH